MKLRRTQAVSTLGMLETESELGELVGARRKHSVFQCVQGDQRKSTGRQSMAALVL